MSKSATVLENSAKSAVYDKVLPQAKSLVDKEVNLISNLANISALLKEAFDFLWVGFYLVQGESLVVGPFQGPIACTRIQRGKGVCGSSWANDETLIVHNVHDFPGHIACSGKANSEIVVPVRKDGQVIAVLDIDHECLGAFDETDKVYLEKLVDVITGQNA